MGGGEGEEKRGKGGRGGLWREGRGGEGRGKKEGGGKGHRGPAMGAKATQAKRPHNAKHTTDKPQWPRAPP